MSKKKTMICGRPKMPAGERMLAVQIRLKPATIEALERFVGNKRSTYVREAIEKKILLDFGE